MDDSFLKVFCLRVGIISVPVVLFVLIFHGMDRHFEQQNALVAERHIVDELVTRVNAHLNGLISEFLILQSSAELTHYADQQDAVTRNKVQERFLSFADATLHYDQVRLLDLSGQEVVRVNFSGQTSILLREDDLQDKSSRSYFRNALSLPPNHLYISPLDLNIEKGVVEEPWKPMIRLSGLIHDSNGTPWGVLVLNYLAEHFLSELSRLDMLHAGSIMLLNDRGYWLYGEHKEQRWGFMFGNHRHFGSLYPGEWEHIRGLEADQVSASAGTFTHQTIRFPSNDHGIKTSTKWIREWKLVSLLSPDVSAHQSTQRMFLLLPLTPLILLLLVWVVWLWTRASVTASTRQQRLYELSRVVEQSEELVYITDKGGNIQYVNPAFEVVTGYMAHEVIGMNPRFLKSGKQDEAHYQQLWQTILAGKPFQDIFINKRKDGRFYYEEKLITPIYDEKSREIVQFVSTGRDISEVYRIKEMRDIFCELAYHDALTGLPNRPYLHEQLSRAMQSADRLEKLVAVVFLDLDGFKPVNDTLGHGIGDALLQNVAVRLQHIFRKTDTVGRLGGDEFLVIVEHLEQVEAVEKLADKLIEEISKPYYFDKKEVSISASVGISLYPFENLEPDTLINQADKAMYLAKNRGKNRYCFYTHNQD
jgi:diguanylate cyclase (GGDEF)-like protein/PAS domain S-box-containing protein